MKNAEKLAKDTKAMAKLISNFDCTVDCSSCPWVMVENCIYKTSPEAIEEWLESEVKEDECINSL